jgi:hypothetical protein
MLRIKDHIDGIDADALLADVEGVSLDSRPIVFMQN